jgi:cell wall-associated NlpC family hydrolase
LEYAVQRAPEAPISTMPSGRQRRLAILAIALSMAVTLIATVSHAPAFAFQTIVTESSAVGYVAADENDSPTTRATPPVSNNPPVRDSVHKPANSSNDRPINRQSTSRPSNNPPVRDRVHKPTNSSNDRPDHRQSTSRPDSKAHVTPNRASTASQSQGRRIARLAASHLGARFQLGANGMRSFDCSGLIYRVYAQAGLLGKIGGNRTAAGYYYWFKQRGLANRHSPKVGDLVVWTHNGVVSHSGIYVGGGRVISALINPWGVKKTHINTIHARFLAYLHVR